MKNQGNTLIEVLIYIALVAIIASTSLYFVINLIHGRIKSSLQENISHNHRLSSRRLTYEIKQAIAINNLTSNTLCLESSTVGRNNTRIFLENDRLYVGWGGDCTTSNYLYPLTSNNLTISDLLFSNSNNTITYSYQISGKQSSGRQEWTYETTASGSATLR